MKKHGRRGGGGEKKNKKKFCLFYTHKLVEMQSLVLVQYPLGPPVFSSGYEKPAPTGLSINNIPYFLFQDCLRSNNVTPSLPPREYGPISLKRPKSEEPPGPPWSQIKSGAFSS